MIDKKLTRVVCGNCSASVIPRVIYCSGVPMGTFCPFCGTIFVEYERHRKGKERLEKALLALALIMLCFFIYSRMNSKITDNIKHISYLNNPKVLFRYFNNYDDNFHHNNYEVMVSSRNIDKYIEDGWFICASDFDN